MSLWSVRYRIHGLRHPVIAFSKAPCPSLSKMARVVSCQQRDEAIETVARIEDIDRVHCRRHVERHFTRSHGLMTIYGPETVLEKAH
jgi:hypothetical protein